MKNIVILILSIFILANCATKYDTLTIQDITETITHDETTYFVVTTDDLKKVKHPSTLTYLGSLENYHLFRIWEKRDLYSSGHVGSMITFFAAKKSECTICEEKSPSQEYMKSWRHVEFKNGKCIVECRK
jgi:uncharacterized protein YxeA